MKILTSDLETKNSPKEHLTNPLYLRELDMGQYLTFETLLTEGLVRITALESKAQSGDIGISEVKR